MMTKVGMLTDAIIEGRSIRETLAKGNDILESVSQKVSNDRDVLDKIIDFMKTLSYLKKAGGASDLKYNAWLDDDAPYWFVFNDLEGGSLSEVRVVYDPDSNDVQVFYYDQDHRLLHGCPSWSELKSFERDLKRFVTGIKKESVMEETGENSFYEIVYGYQMAIVQTDWPTTDYGALVDILIDNLEKEGVKEPYLLQLDKAEEEYNEDEYVVGGNHGLALIHNGNFNITPIPKQDAMKYNHNDHIEIYTESKSIKEDSAGKLVSVKVVDEPKGKGVEIKTSTGALYYYTVDKNDAKYNTPEKLVNAVRGLAGKHNKDMGRIYKFLNGHALNYDKDITVRANLKKTDIAIEQHGKGLVVSLDNGQVYRYTVDRKDKDYTSLAKLKDSAEGMWRHGASVDQILNFLDSHALLYAREGRRVKGRTLKEDSVESVLPYQSSANRLLDAVGSIKQNVMDLDNAVVDLVYDSDGIIAEPDFCAELAKVFDKNSPFKARLFDVSNMDIDYWQRDLANYFAKWNLRESRQLREETTSLVWKITGLVWDKTDDNGNEVDVYLPDIYLISANETDEKGIAAWLYDKFGYFPDEFDSELVDGFEFAADAINEAKESDDYSKPQPAAAKQLLKVINYIDINVGIICDMITELCYADADYSTEIMHSNVDREFCAGLEKAFNKNNPFKKDMYGFTDLYQMIFDWKKDFRLFFAKWGLKESKSLTESMVDDVEADLLKLKQLLKKSSVVDNASISRWEESYKGTYTITFDDGKGIMYAQLEYDPATRKIILYYETYGAVEWYCDTTFEDLISDIADLQAFRDSQMVECQDLIEAEELNTGKRFDLVDVLGYKALYTTGRFKVDGPFEGVRIYAYDIKGCEDDPKELGTLETRVLENRIGSMLFLKTIKTPTMIKDQVKFTGEKLSVAEIIAIYESKIKTA